MEPVCFISVMGVPPELNTHSKNYKSGKLQIFISGLIFTYILYAFLTFRVEKINQAKPKISMKLF